MDEESKREAHRAFIPAPNGAMKGLRKVNADLVGFVQSRSPQTEHSGHGCHTGGDAQAGGAPQLQEAQGYQPLITYWSEAELIVHPEFGTAMYLRAISSCEC